MLWSWPNLKLSKKICLPKFLGRQIDASSESRDVVVNALHALPQYIENGGVLRLIRYRKTIRALCGSV